MAVRKPLVLGADGLPQQLQSTDSTGTHAYFTGSSTSMPAISLGGTTYITLPVTPVTTGDSLAIGEKVDAVASVDLPNGVAFASVRVSAVNTVRLGFVSTAVLSLTTLTIAWTITAHR